jgi:putative ABC transport system permease protein
MIGLRLLYRDWRGGDVTVLLVALALAVAIVTGLSLFSERLGNAITAQSTRLMGADMVLESPRPVAAEILAQAEMAGLQMSSTVAFASMAAAGDRFQISSVKAVESSYPLKGKVLLADAPLAEAYSSTSGLEPGNLWVDSRLLAALGVAVGDGIDIGEARLNIQRLLVNEPDGAGSSFALGPRVIMHYEDLQRAAVVQEGSRVRYRYYFVGDESALAGYRQYLEPNLLPEHRIYTVTEGRPRVAGAIEKAQSYLLLGGALGVALAGAAIAIAARRHTERHIQHVAVLKTLGASSWQIASIYLQKFAALLVVGVLLGFLLGWLMQWVIVSLIGSIAELRLEPAGWYPYILGGATGLICLFSFALPPLWSLRNVSPLAALRKDVEIRRLGPLAAALPGVTGMFILMVWYSGSLELAGAVFAGLLLAMALVALPGWLLIRSTGIVGSNAGNMWLLASSTLRRRGLENAMQVVVFAITVMLLLVLVVTRTSLVGDWEKGIPEQTPNHFLVNVQPSEVQDLKSWLRQRQLEDAGLYPLVRGRLTHINGAPMVKRIADDSNTSAELDRELALTSSAEMPADNALLEGRWWSSSSDDAVVSIEADIAAGLGAVLGDRLRFQVGSRVFEAEVASIREVNWENMRPNFYMIFPPRLLADYPTTYMTSFYLAADKKPLLVDMLQQFPTLTVIEVDAIIAQIRSIIRQVSLAIEAILWVVMACGVLVLIATVQSGMSDRYRESSILRTLGAPARLVLGSITIEFLLLGLIAGLLAAAGAELTTWMLQERVFRADWQWHPRLWVLGPLVSGGLIMLIGTLTSRKAVTTPPVEVLRSLV